MIEADDIGIPDTDGGAIAAFTFSVVGLVLSLGAPGVIAATIVSSDVQDRTDLLYAIAGAVIVLLVFPVVALIGSVRSDTRIDRSRGDLHGAGLAEAARIISLAAVFVICASLLSIAVEIARTR